MSTRKRSKAIQNILRQIGSLPGRLIKGAVLQLMRNLFAIRRFSRAGQAGFVLPTTVLLLLVLTLAVGSITLRTYSRTQQTIGQRQSQVIYNAATPAIDRAKAKLEFLFDPSQNPRFPGGVPGEDQIFGMMLNDPTDPAYAFTLTDGADPYTFPDELASPAAGDRGRLDIDQDGVVDNAWSYLADTDGDGADDALVAYSIIFNTPDAGDTFQLSNTTDAALSDSTDGRAKLLQVRHAPLSNAAPQGTNCDSATGAILVEDGWFQNQGSTSSLVKNFQVDVYVQPIADANGTPDLTRPPSTLEFHQDRQINRGNTWGAWFRNDLEIYPGPNFNWNGAMHTEGNLIVASGNGTFEAYMVSSPDSCLYRKDASEVTVASSTYDDGGLFAGQAIGGKIAPRANDNQTDSFFHLFTTPIDAPDREELTRDDDSLTDATDIADLALDPVQILTRNRSVARGNPDFQAVRTADWKNEATPFQEKERILLDSRPSFSPALDDSYRADNRYGPVPVYRNNVEIPSLGDPIPAAELLLTLDDPPVGAADPTELGLDGYWERRARREGMRLVVGQRLELGNLAGWGGVDPNGGTTGISDESEPLRPWATCTTNNVGRCHEARQRRTLRDNIAAVQATAVYHTGGTLGDGDIPRACVATTVHPGTAKTLREAATFENLNDATGALDTTNVGNLIISNFFWGKGTNGWEYNVPDVTNAAVVQALTNLANYAGDPSGGAPSFPPVQDTNVHPYPSMAMWGDFSVLRRILDGGVAYASLSPADKTVLHTAACTLGMLAYNVQYLADYDPAAAGAATLRGQLATRIQDVVASPGFTSGTTPEGIIAGLEKLRDTAPGANDNELIAMARMIMTREQVLRDQEFGFSPGFSNLCLSTGLLGGNANLSRLCSNRPKFPILYSLFPLAAHGEDASSRDSIDAADTYITGAGGSYGVVDLTQVLAQPKPLADWVLPTGATTTGTIPNSNTGIYIRECVTAYCSANDTTADTLIPVALKDSALFDGREMMTARVLDLDLDLMRSSAVGTDFWLPKSGIIYAFREDGAREDSITRPATSGPCDNDAEIQSTACQMEATDVAAYGDPILATNGISPKPVDYYADPDRRVHGFRLRNGQKLARDEDEGRGLSFITDNTVYVQGDFNLHQVIGGDNTESDANRLEEFSGANKLPIDAVYDFDTFYNRTGLDENFARPEGDEWRPAEILADSFTILSRNFCDGSIQDGILTVGEDEGAVLTAAQPIGYLEEVYGCLEVLQQTSFMNQNRPSDDDIDYPGDYFAAQTIQDDVRGSRVYWHRENPFDPNSPIAISRNGNPLVADIGRYAATDPIEEREYDSTYFAFDENRPLRLATTTRVNATIISGIIPSRADQSYGGLHNFPRFLENWPNTEFMRMSGAFLQINFSTSATGPFDQDAWEPGTAPSVPSGAGEAAIIKYYDPPSRLWGYDVGLQYAPAGPVSRRFTPQETRRSEFYNEPQANDPYIRQLCLTIPDATCPQ